MITHMEAAGLRIAAANGDVLRRLNGAGMIHNDILVDWELTTEGADALAEYIAHYATIERAELERLRALERKIGAFLGSISVSETHIEAGDIAIARNDDHHWEIRGYPCEGEMHSGGALRKAFERFEVSGEGA